MIFMKHKNKGRGVTLLVFICIVAIISILSMALHSNMLTTFAGSVRLERNIQALHLAEAGLETVLYRLNHEDKNLTAIPQQRLGSGSFEVIIQHNSNNSITVISKSGVPAERPSITRTVIAELIESNGIFTIKEKKFN